MPIYEYGCSTCGARVEEIKAYDDRNNTPRCPNGHRTHRLATMPYVRPERMYVDDPLTGHRLVRNDSGEDPWAGSGAEDRMRAQVEERARLTKKQTKIQVDHGSKTNVGANH